MPERSPTPRAALAELLVTAAAELSAPLPPVPVPDGRPVIRGRVALGRYRRLVDRDGCCAVAVGFATAVWLGPPGAEPPSLDGLVHRDRGSIDGRGRLVLPRAVRAYLAVADPDSFDALVVATPGHGLLLVPCEEFTRRQQEVARALAC